MHHVITTDALSLRNIYEAERAVYLETGIGDRFEPGSGSLVGAGDFMWEVRDAADVTVATIGVAQNVRRRYTAEERARGERLCREANPEGEAYMRAWMAEGDGEE